MIAEVKGFRIAAAQMIVILLAAIIFGLAIIGLFLIGVAALIGLAGERLAKAIGLPDVFDD